MFFAVLSELGGIGPFLENAGNWSGLSPFSFAPQGESGYLGYAGHLGWLYYIAAWLSIAIGGIAAQDFMQRVLAAKDETTTVRGSYIAGIMYLTIASLTPLIGIAMYEINPGLTIAETEMMVPWLSMQYLPPALTVIFVAGIIAALMSSSDSGIIAASSLLGYNLLRYMRPKATDRDTLVWSRITVPLVTVVAVCLALFTQTVYKLMVIAWTILLVGLFASFACGFFWRKTNQYGALASLMGGIASWIGLIFYYLPATMEENVGVIVEGQVYMEWALWDAIYIASVPAFVVSILLLVAVSLFTQKIDPPKPFSDVDGKPMEVKDWMGW